MPVFEPDTELILNNSLDIACRFGASRVGTDHVLLSLAQSRDTLASKSLYALGASASVIAAKIVSTGYTTRLCSSDLTPSLRCAIEVANALCDRKPISAEGLLRALLSDRANAACKILTDLRIDIDSLCFSLIYEKSEKQKSLPQSLLKFGRDLTAMAESGALDVCACRNLEIAALSKILCRKSKNNACLVGEAGVGKTAIVEGLAALLASQNAPAALKGRRVFALDIASMVAGAKYRGEFEERLRTAIRELSVRRVIVFIDELHTIIGAGSAEGSIDACGILKPALARGGLQVIGATTFDEYEKYIEKDLALSRRFQKIEVKEPSIAQCRDMLLALKPAYEKFHKITITDEAIDAAINLSVKFMPTRFLPDKAIDLLDESAGALRLFGSGDTLTAAHIEAQTAEKTGTPIERVRGRLSLSMCESALLSQILGQEGAIKKTCDIVFAGAAGLTDKNRPLASLIFSGPSGVGKSALAGALAENLFGKDALVRLDMSEYSQPHTVARLIGSPPGYVGFEEGGHLVTAVRKHPSSVILFDEIEKAHPDIYNILLQILDGGVLTDSHGKRANFSNAVVILTTNAKPSGRYAGFIKPDAAPLFEGLFANELVGRFDAVIEFSPLSPDTLQKIAANEFSKIVSIASARGAYVEFAEECAAALSKCDGTSLYGARALKRAIDRQVSLPLARALISGADSIRVGTDGQTLSIDVPVKTRAE